MNARPRSAAAALKKGDLPAGAGVYAWYEAGRPIYVGVGESVQDRIWSQHLRRGLSMKTSSFRRNLAEDHGVGSAADIKAGLCRPTRVQVDRVNDRIRACAVAWIECQTIEEAADLERRMKLEWLPPFTKR
jgi:hypothetical protein